jgi:hypothetical protein
MTGMSVETKVEDVWAEDTKREHMKLRGKD